MVDKGEGIFQNVYEMLLLDNRPSQEVATKTDLSGPLENPEISTWQIIVEIIRNAFFKDILPKFDHEEAGAAAKVLKITVLRPKWLSGPACEAVRND